MVRSGLLLRSDDDADRRITRIRLSPKGRSMARKLVAQAREHESLVLSTVDDADAKALKRMLRALIREHAGPGAR